ncbi:MAG TPA: TadE/TadG family type IV pilus assembly protein [Rhizomicrobium sp.]|jgi:Flp pilus assembly protein TadG
MLNLLSKFRRAKDGVAAIEFALFLPVLTVLILGLIEITSALQCRQRVTALASSSADLVAQYNQVSSSEMTDIFSAVNQVLYPFPTSASTVVISSVLSDGAGNGKVAWSRASAGGSARSTNSSVTVPTGLMPAYVCSGGVCTGCAAGACSVIMSEVRYNYTSYSNTAKFITGQLTLTDSFYAKPRRSTTVTLGS